MGLGAGIHGRCSSSAVPAGPADTLLPFVREKYRARIASAVPTRHPFWQRVKPGLLLGRRTREHVQTAGPRLRERPQRNAFGSAGLGPELVESTADKSQMNRAHHFWIAMGCLEQGTAMQPDDADPGVGAWGEPELIKQCDHGAASGHSAARHRRAGALTRVQLVLPDQLATPRPACLNGVGAGLRAG